MDKIEIIPDNSSQRALNLNTIRKVEDADNVGIQTITPDTKFLRGASAQSVDFSALVQNLFSYTGL